MKENTLVTVGKVTGVHGLAGNLKVWSFDGTTDIFREGRSVQLKAEKGSC
jgi:16S rRNA processing protein RimM